MSIGEKAGQGFVSYINRNILSRFLGMFSLFVLAHKLSPADFGLVSITQVLLNLIGALGASGLFEYLQSYRKDDFKTMAKATFWFNIAMSGAIVLLFYMALPFWASYKNDARILYIGIFLGINFLLIQLQIIPRAVLSKNLEFKKLVAIQNPFIVLTPISNIIAAYAGMGVYSLVIPNLVLLPIQVFLLYRAIKWKFSFYIYRERWRGIFSYSKYLLGSTILARLTDDGDKFILGSVLGLEALGLYNMAFQLANFINANIITISSNILVSVLPKYRDDIPNMKKHFLNFTGAISFITFPLILLVIPFAYWLILTVNGPGWVNAVLPFQILSIYACIRSVTSNRGAVMNALHQNKRVFKMMIYYTPLHIVSSFISSYYFGTTGVAINMVVLRFIFAAWGVFEMMRFIDGSLMDFIHSFRKAFYLNIVILIPLLVIMYSGLDHDVANLYKIYFNWSSTAWYGFTFVICMLFSFIIYYFIGRIFFTSLVKEVGEFVNKVNPTMGKIFKRVYGV